MSILGCFIHLYTEGIFNTFTTFLVEFLKLKKKEGTSDERMTNSPEHCVLPARPTGADYMELIQNGLSRWHLQGRRRSDGALEHFSDSVQDDLTQIFLDMDQFMNLFAPRPKTFGLLCAGPPKRLVNAAGNLISHTHLQQRKHSISLHKQENIYYEFLR